MPEFVFDLELTPDSPTTGKNAAGSDPEETYPLAQNKTHAVTGVSRLLSQFAEKPVLEAVIAAALKEVQELEDESWNLLLSRNLTNATGQLLDDLGEFLDRKRETLSDDDYREVLKIRASLLRGSGQTERVLQLAVDKLDGLSDLVIRTDHTATFTLELSDVVTPAEARSFHRLIEQAIAAGILYSTLYTIALSADTFTLSSQIGTIESSTTQGLGDAAQSQGGRLAGVKSNEK